MKASKNTTDKTDQVAAGDIFTQSEKVVTELSDAVDSYVAPVRRTVLERFPVVFLLLTTFGVAAVFYGFEQILAQYELLRSYPWLITLIGVCTLAFTGKLYQKLR